MDEEIVEQITEIRDSGRTNMFDLNAVEQIADEMGFYALVCFIEDNREDYVNFILTGKIKEE